MNQPTPDHHSQEQNNLIKDNVISGDVILAPRQIGTIIETQIIVISRDEVTRKDLNPKSPYQGLEKFNFKDRDRFFGRDKLIAELFEVVNRSSLSLVLGASGSGKSSVVRAGLIPELKKSLENNKFYDFIFTPNDDPFDSLYRCLLSEETDYNFSKAEAEIALEAKADTMKKVIRTLKKDKERWLIFIDQFEELFTCKNKDKIKNFIKNLVKIAKSGDSSVKLVLAMRSDFLEQFSFYPDLGAIANQNNIHLVTEMHTDQLRQAIEQPAAKHGVVFEEGLVEQIIKEVEGQKGYLPLLQYTLDLLWKRECQTLGADGRPDIEDRTLNRKSYAMLEGVRGALQKRVNEIYNPLDQKQQLATRQIFLSLVGFVNTDLGTKVVSKRAYRNDFSGESVEEMLNKFIEEKLLVSSDELLSQEKLVISGSQHKNKSATVEIAHEILLSSWDKLKSWVDEEQTAITEKSWLASETKRWSQSSSNDDLLKGSRLAQFVELRETDAFKNLGGLTEEQNRFIDASIKHRDLEQKKDELRRKRTIQSLTGGLVGALILTGIAVWQWQSSEFQRKHAETVQEGQVNALVSYSEVLYSLNKDFDALVEGLRAGKLLKQISKPDISTKIQLINALDQAYSRVQETNRLEGHTNWVWTANFSTDGKKLISAGKDGKIKIWNRDGSVISTIDENSLWVSFSPKGQMIASINTDDNGVNPSGTMTLRKLDGTLPKTISSNGSSFLWGSFSPDGQKIAIANGDGTVKIWSIEGELLNVLRGHQGPVNRVTFSPDGTMIASASQDKTIKLWKSDGSLLKTLQGHQGSVWGISFSPDSRMLVSGGEDKTVRLWKIDGTLLDTFTGHKDWVWNVSFSPNGKLIASASADNTIRVWNLEGQLIKTLQGHKGDVLSVNFSPDDAQTLVSTGVDNTIRLWNLEDHVSSTVQEYTKKSPDGLIGVLEDPDNDKNIKLQNLLTGEVIPLKGHQDKIKAYITIFSPDGQILATRSEDKTIKIWQVDGTLLQTIQSNSEQIVFSPDNQILAVLEDDNKTIKWWKIDRTPTGTRDKTPIILEDPTGKISNISFSPDSKMITTSSEDGIIRLWNLSGQPPVVLRGHKGKISKVIFSPNGKIIASTGEDGTIRLWNLSGQQLSKFSEGDIGIEFDINPKTKTVTINKVKQDYPAAKEGVKEGDEIVAIDGKSISEILENDGISTNEMNEIKIFSRLRGKAGTSVKLKISSPYHNKNYDIQLNRSQIVYYTAPWILFGSSDTVPPPPPPPEYLKSLKELKKLRELKIIPEITPEQEYAETHPSKHQASYQNIEFSKDGRTIMTDPFTLWDIKGNLLKILPLIGTYNLEQQKILVISQEGIQIWNFDGQLLKTLSGFNTGVKSAAFSPDGKFIISESEDSEGKNKTVKIWDLDGRLIKVLDWSNEKNQIIYDLMMTKNGNNSLSKYLDILLSRGCSWTKNYIKTNSNLNDPSICNDFNSQSAQIESKPKSN